MKTFDLQRIVLITCVYALCSSCSLYSINSQVSKIDNASVVHGKVSSAIKDVPLYVAIFKYSGQVFQLTDHSLVEKNNLFEYNVLPQDLAFSAFADVNRDGKYQEGEPATYLGIENKTPRIISIKPNETIDVGELRIEGPIKKPENITVVDKQSRISKNLGRVVSFDEPMFAPEAQSVGLWRPLDYLNEYGGGIVFLQSYDAAKTPVLFVHGIAGSATSFTPELNSLDTEHFQPWIFQYPSGLNLGILSNYVDDALLQLQAKYGFKDIIIVAHSMGGLLTHAFIKQYVESAPPYKLRFVMTINSPLYGMDSAATGVRHSPIVVPSWRDVASGSDFVKTVHSKPWPEDLPYFLVFSYLPGEEGDGVVPLKSQLSLQLQDKAVGIMGFEAGHTDILANPDFVKRFQAILNNYR
ncbi:alpha/beta hydrolase family protein DUF915 [Alteromonadaceae bacterium 2753L.S.0a.02]|nr:alpha/beta hydrolase family protein DUF915 [Alteromonadaceae bacterium 2753L.S.0a.02]